MQPASDSSASALFAEIAQAPVSTVTEVPHNQQVTCALERAVASPAAAAASSRNSVQNRVDTQLRYTQLQSSIAWGTPCVFEPTIAATQTSEGFSLFSPWLGDDPLTGGKVMDGTPCPPLVSLRHFETAAVGYYSVPLTLAHTAPHGALCRRSPRELYRGEWPDDWRTAISKALSAASPILCRFPQSVDLSACAFSFQGVDGRYSTYPQTPAGLQHPYNLDVIRNHPLSLLSLVPECDMLGFQSVYCHSQFGYDHTKMRQGTLRASCVHHTVKGRSICFIVPPEQHDRALHALVEILAAHFQLPSCLPPTVRRLVLMAFYAQQVFVHPNELRRRGVTVHAHMLHAGEVFYARGDCVYWTLNQADHSMSMNTHVLPESWLEYGPAGCLQDAQFLQAIAQTCGTGSEVQSELAGLYSAHLTTILHQLPQSWVCHLFHVIATDIEKHLQHLRTPSSATAESAPPTKSRFTYSLPEATLQRASSILEEVRAIMHEPGIVALAAAHGVACISDPSRCHFRRTV